MGDGEGVGVLVGVGYFVGVEYFVLGFGDDLGVVVEVFCYVVLVFVEFVCLCVDYFGVCWGGVDECVFEGVGVVVGCNYCVVRVVE